MSFREPPPGHTASLYCICAPDWMARCPTCWGMAGAKEDCPECQGVGALLTVDVTDEVVDVVHYDRKTGKRLDQ